MGPSRHFQFPKQQILCFAENCKGRNHSADKVAKPLPEFEWRSRQHPPAEHDCHVRSNQGRSDWKAAQIDAHHIEKIALPYANTGQK
jgi:hypothetical protein